jgi:hypothetical protein
MSPITKIVIYDKIVALWDFRCRRHIWGHGIENWLKMPPLVGFIPELSNEPESVA